MSKKKKQGAPKLSAQQLQIEILRYLLANPQKRLNSRQLIQHLGVANNKDSTDHALNQLVLMGSVTDFPEEKFGIALDRLTRAEADPESEPQAETPAPPARPEFVKEGSRKPQKGSESTPAINPRNKREGRKEQLIEGRVDMTRTGSAYVVSELRESDVYVSSRYLNGALHNDIVRVSLFPPAPARRGRPERKREGEIVQVLQRANEFFIGTLRKGRKYAVFMPDNPNMPVDIYVPLDACADARDGEKVVVRITDWQEGTGRAPEGKVTQVLGDVGGNNFEMNKILINNGFELSHTDEALAEALSIPDTISPNEIAMRRDFREILTFTIDPEDAKDFDDALSFRKLEDGKLEVGVHIADVTHYLKPDSPMDREAYQRSTSVYLVDRVCPMLPEKLSNNLCSLVPGQDRLAFSAVFVFDEKDKIVSRWFGKTVIFSAKRFAYEEAQTILDKKPTPELLEHPRIEELTEALLTLNRIAGKMRKAREKNGAIGFETEEVRFLLAEDGTPIEAYIKERKAAHLLIEDFMLLANKEVATYVEGLGKKQSEVPFVYRVHDLPDLERVAELGRFAFELGYAIKLDTPKQIAQGYNELMRAAQKDERLKLLMPLAIRTMAKAVYTTTNIGHYGLGFTHYSHFTSPIRRYSDVLAHRILERNLEGRVWRTDKAKLEEQCKHVSAQERKAADAERESIKYKQTELISRHIGEEFNGVVSGMVDRGFFVELSGSRAEGMVEFKLLDDQYLLDESGLRANGRRYNKQIRIGDKVRVRVVQANITKRQIDLELME